MLDNKAIEGAMTIQLGNEYPDYPEFQEGIRRAPDRGFRLTKAQTRIALKNALRYVPEELHEKLAPEFMEELTTRGRIYAYRYRPEGRMHGKPIEEYKGKCLAGKAFQVMIDNNLDFDVALYPYELVTYGETGQVCQNWLQYRLIKKYLEELTEDQTLVVESGHPLGLFPSKPEAPRVIITNSLMIGMYDNLADWEIAEEMGVANYGQMTAGGWMYIGPQGIVHGTFNTILNAGRKELGVPVIVTQQYTRGLGQTVPVVAEALGEFEPIDKVTFSCCGNIQFNDALEEAAGENDRTSVIIAGCETHICVEQTALDLMEIGFKVFLPADAVQSRSREHKEVSLRRMEAAGAVITNYESVLYEMLGSAKAPEFKAISAIVK